MAILNWTGNPLVDTGLAVMIARAGKEKIEDFTADDFNNVVSDGIWLAKANRQLKAFAMVVGINSPLTNPSLNSSLRKKNGGKLDPRDDEGLKQYCKLLIELKESALKDLKEESALKGKSGKFLCESCGERPATEVLSKYKKRIGRDWFPLAGSIGSDAQTLPAASRTARICSQCLLSIQFLPLGSIIVGGKIACFQYTYMELTQLFVKKIYKETINNLQLLKSGDKLPAIGQGKGTKIALIELIDTMYELQSNKRIYELPQFTSLNIWLFSNSGQEPDSDLIEIPNDALTFLWNAAMLRREEIEKLVMKESKKIDFQLLECIKRKSEYAGFYPQKETKPASKELFELYHTKVLGNSSSKLKIAEWLAYQIKTKLSTGNKNDNKLLSKLIKEAAYKDKELLAKIKGIFAELAEEGLFSLEDYSLLFPRETETKQIRIKNDGFKWIWFYLNHENINDKKPEGGDNLFTHPLIKAFAKDTFDYYQKEKGMKYIEKKILDAFKKGEITTSDLQRWFINLAKIKEGYTNEKWDDLCRDDNGNNMTNEVRFQFRLEMANLYRLAGGGK